MEDEVVEVEEQGFGATDGSVERQGQHSDGTVVGVWGMKRIRHSPHVGTERAQDLDRSESRIVSDERPIVPDEAVVQGPCKSDSDQKD